jgi:glutaredoxin
MHLMYIIRQFYKIKGHLSISPHSPHLLSAYPDLAESRLRISNYFTNRCPSFRHSLQGTLTTLTLFLISPSSLSLTLPITHNPQPIMSTPKIILYTNRACPWAHRAHIALKESGLDYEEVTIDLTKPREPWYLDVNPVSITKPPIHLY